MANTKALDTEKRQRRNEKRAKSEKLTNGFMLALTYGLAGIILLEIVRRHYLRWDLEAWAFAGKFCTVLGVIFAIAAAVVVILGCIKKIAWSKVASHTPLFAVSSILSFFLVYDTRLSISTKLWNSVPLNEQMTKDWGMMDFLANLNLAKDTQYVEYGVIAAIVVAFVVYAIRLAINEKKR